MLMLEGRAVAGRAGHDASHAPWFRSDIVQKEETVSTGISCFLSLPRSFGPHLWMYARPRETTLRTVRAAGRCSARAFGGKTSHTDPYWRSSRPRTNARPGP